MKVANNRWGIIQKTREGGSGVFVEGTSSQPSANVKENAVTGPVIGPGTATEGSGTPNMVTYQSGWVSGGHNQIEMCTRGQLQLEKESNVRLTLVRSDEKSRKDWLGHVTYNYYCEFQLIPKA